MNLNGIFKVEFRSSERRRPGLSWLLAINISPLRRGTPCHDLALLRCSGCALLDVPDDFLLL